MKELTLFAPLAGLLGMVIAYIIYSSIKRQPDGNELMRQIASQIYEGAMAFLRREYGVLVFFIAVVAVLIGVFIDYRTAIAFVSGAACSILAGFFGMQAATRANVRTAEAARSDGQGKALLTAFHGGAVMGISVASLGLIGVGIFFYFYGSPATAQIINGFAMGASSIALFARVGGGIYTKAADVGADLVGKVEAGIPEDDPRNPGVIADNVGDNVGDVAGMGADIFESYVGSIVATIAIGATLFSDTLAGLKANESVTDDTIKTILMALPLVLALFGLFASLIGIGSMRILNNFLQPQRCGIRHSSQRGCFFLAAGGLSVPTMSAIMCFGLFCGEQLEESLSD